MILVSIFRDAENYVERYMEQCERLRGLLAEADIPLRRVMVEGDSTDHTWKVLEEAVQPGDILLKCEHGGPTFPSKNLPMRWRQIALASNVAITAAVRDNYNREPVVWMESDLIWEPEVVTHLLGLLHTYPAVAPMCMQGARFYDIWGYVKDDRFFSPWPPYHPGINTDRMVTIQSAGSCLAMTADAAQFVEFSSEDCIRGVGRSLYANGHSLWLDPTITVRHP